MTNRSRLPMMLWCATLWLPLGPAGAQDDPYAALRAYDGQGHQAVAAIAAQVRQAQGDPARYAEIEQKLLVVLADAQTTAAAKLEVCRLLRLVGTARSVPALAALLSDARLCDVACFALAPLADPAAGQALLAALPGATGPARLAVINALGDRREAAAVAALKPLLGDGDEALVTTVMHALGRIGTVEAVTAMLAVPGRALPWCQAMLAAADGLLADGRRAEAQAVYTGLIIEGLPEAARGAALHGLVVSGAPNAIEAVLAALQSPQPRVYQGAGKLVTRLVSSGAAPRVLALYAGLTPAAQQVVLTALADAGQAAAAPLVVAGLKSEDAGLRLAAVRAAVAIGGAAAVAPLVEIARSGAERQAAREALVLIRGPEAAAAIAQLAGEGTPEQRVEVIGLLAERNSRSAVPMLLTAAGGPERKVAIAAWKVLPRLAGASDYAKLVKLLVAQGDDAVRAVAQTSLVQVARRVVTGEQALAPVLAELPAAKGEVLATLVGVLAGLGGDRAVAEITRYVRSAEAEVKRAAIEALANDCDDSRAVPTLLDVARIDADAGLRVLALRGILRIVNQDERLPADDKVQRLVEVMALAKRPDEKIAVLGVLRNCRVPAAVQLAATLLDDQELNGEAVSTILYLAMEQKKGNRRQAAVKGPQVKAVLRRVVATTTSTTMREQARKLLQ